MGESKKDSKVTLVETAFALPDSEKEFGMKIADHKLICAVLDDHMASTEDMMDEKIMKTLQSDKLTDTIADKVYDKLAEFNQPVLLKLEELINGIEEIKTQNKLEIARLDLRADANRDAVKDLRTDYEIYKEHLEYLAKVKPTLETIQNVFRFWTWKENKKKIIGASIGIVIGIFILFWIFLSIMKFKGFVSLNDSNKKHSGLEQVMLDIKTGNVSNDVRAAKALKLTDAQRDTMIAQKEKILIKPVNMKQ
jgi:hypothetical protein